ncbi:MAG TPA: ABC transporter substrate-binding protein [Firmicutes bacterium]|nr:ABC transporter substrate-binding protein [Bacillota bacterium]
MRRVILLAFLFALAGWLVLVGGCSQGGQPTQQPPEQGTGTKQNTGPIKIGAPLPLTGAYAADGEHMSLGLTMAVEDLNARGGLLGRQVELITYDIQDLLAETVTASAKSLVEKDHVSVVVAGYAGYGPDFLSYGKYEVPYLHGSGSVRGAELVRDNPAEYGNIFQVFPIEASYGKRAFEVITGFPYQYPNKKMALVHGDLEWDLNYTKGIKELAEQQGWEIVMDETVPYGTTEWRPVLTQIRSLKPSVICCSTLSVPDISSFVRQFRENPTNSLLDISYMVVFQEVKDATGSDLDGVMGYVTSLVRPTPDGQEWKQRFEKRFGMPVPLTTPPSTYDTVMIWAKAVERVGNPDDYKAVCEAIRTHPYEGLLGKYDFNNPEQTVRTGPDFPIAYAQRQNGELKFYGQDTFILPPWIQPAWPKK